MKRISQESGLTALLYALAVFMLTACMQSVDFERFINDPEVIDIINKTRVGLIDLTEDKHLTAGNSRITGLKDNLYYMIEELDEDSNTIHIGFVGSDGIRWSNLSEIGRVTNGTIINLNNNNTYKVSTADPFTGELIFDDIPAVSAPPASVTTSITVAAGIIMLEAPNDSYYLDVSSIIPGSNTWQAVMAISPTWVVSSVTLPSSNIILLRDANTVTDYIFAEFAGTVPTGEFKVLTVIIREKPPEPEALIINITISFTPDGTPVINDSWGDPVTLPLSYSQTATGVIINVNITGSYTEITWSFDGESVGTGSALSLDITAHDFLTIIGSHELTVEAKNGGKPYSASIPVEVTP